MVSRGKSTGLPLPPGPTTGTHFEGVSIETLDPCRSFGIRVDRDGVLADVEWTSFTGPVDLSLNGSGDQVVAAGHYNSLGSARGTIRHDDVTHKLDGVGYMDHFVGGPGDVDSVRPWLAAADLRPRTTSSTRSRRGARTARRSRDTTSRMVCCRG